MSYTLDKRVAKLFDLNTLATIGTRIERVAIGSKTKAKTTLNRCEIFSYSSKVESDNVHLYDVYLTEDSWRERLNDWLIDCEELEINSFNYANYFLEKGTDHEGTTTQRVFKVSEEEHHCIDDSRTLYLLSRNEDIDASSFSCRDNYRKERLTEWRAKASPKAPIYISFIHNETLNKYYIKLWFKIDAQADVVIEALKAKS